MYGSHDMRHTGFPQVDSGQWDTLGFGASQSEGLADNSSTHGIFVVAFLYIFLTNIQILIMFYKSLM